MLMASEWKLRMSITICAIARLEEQTTTENERSRLLAVYEMDSSDDQRQPLKEVVFNQIKGD